MSMSEQGKGFMPFSEWIALNGEKNFYDYMQARNKKKTF